MLREELRENRTDLFSVGCLSTQTFLCVAYLQRCWYVYMNIHCVICLQTLRYRFIYFLYVRSAYSARFLRGHTFADSLITALSPTNSTNPISIAIATFITQPTKLGDGMLCLIHSDSVFPFVVNCTMSEQEIKIALYVEYKIWQWNFSFMPLAATLLIFILEAQPYNSHRLSYWEFYISYTPTISLGRGLKFIAIRTIIPWFSTHSIFSTSWNL